MFEGMFLGARLDPKPVAIIATSRGTRLLPLSGAWRQYRLLQRKLHSSFDENSRRIEVARSRDIVRTLVRGLREQRRHSQAGATPR